MQVIKQLQTLKKQKQKGAYSFQNDYPMIKIKGSRVNHMQGKGTISCSEMKGVQVLHKKTTKTPKLTIKYKTNKEQKVILRKRPEMCDRVQINYK